MGEIVQRLQELLSKNIRLNQIVRTIYWKTEEYSEKTNRISILCEDGAIYTTNNLICTLPIGVLKENHLEMFSPPLPKAFREVIAKIGFGTINKIFLHFDEKWWKNDWKGVQFIYNEKLSDLSHWSRYISGFDVAYPEPKNVLIGWIGGRGAIEVEKLDELEIVNKCMKMIRHFLKNPEIPEPNSFFCSRWNGSYSKGSYSFTSRQCDDIHDWDKILSNPITYQSASQKEINTILLAGEACHDKYFSTVHGAFLSGDLQLYGVNVSYCYLFLTL